MHCPVLKEKKLGYTEAYFFLRVKIYAFTIRPISQYVDFSSYEVTCFACVGVTKDCPSNIRQKKITISSLLWGTDVVSVSKERGECSIYSQFVSRPNSRCWH